MTRHSRMKELAKQILSLTIDLDQQLDSCGLPSPSFEESMVDQLPPALHSTQESLLGVADELMLLVRGPWQSLIDFTNLTYYLHSSMHAIVHFGIAQAVPLGATATFSDIAQVCNLDRIDTERLIRHAMTYRIFCETEPGIVAHTACSRLLASNSMFRESIGYAFDEVIPTASYLVKAMTTWPRSHEPNETAWNIVHAESRPLFTVLETDQKRAEKFAKTMTTFQGRPGLGLSYLVDEEIIGWPYIRKIVDVGGSQGGVCRALVAKFPALECVVQDLPQVVSGAQASARITFMAHDFFEVQPVKDADVYLLRWILHDWSDKYAIKILQALLPALRPSSKLVISDVCLPEPGTKSLYQQRYLGAMDLVMKQIQNAKERNREDWEALVKLVDPRLKILEFKQPEGSELSIIILALQ